MQEIGTVLGHREVLCNVCVNLVIMHHYYIYSQLPISYTLLCFVFCTLFSFSVSILVHTLRNELVRFYIRRSYYYYY